MEDKCFALEKAERKMKAARARINEIQKETDGQSFSQTTPTKN